MATNIPKSTSKTKLKVAAAILCWNNRDIIADSVDSLLNQTQPVDVIVVENGSTDGSLEFLQKKYGKKITILAQPRNLGFAGGANVALRHAITKLKSDYVSLLNSDAKADKNWVKELLSLTNEDSKVGLVTSKILQLDGKHIDTTGDMFYSWGIASPRGRGEIDSGKYENVEAVFSACGGASLYSTKMLKDVGLFDEDFFAYYEDVDLSFRARNYGWSVMYNPKAVVYHAIGASSSKMSGFSIKMGIKNQIWVIVKNVPLRYYFQTMLKFKFLWGGNIIHAIKNHHTKQALMAVLISAAYLPKKFAQRIKIQHMRRRRGIKSSSIRAMWKPGLPSGVQNYTTVKIAKKIIFWD